MATLETHAGKPIVRLAPHVPTELTEWSFLWKVPKGYDL